MSIIMYKQRHKPPTDKHTPILNYLHIGYIAMRPRSMKNEDGVHGLFGQLSPTEFCDKMPWQETAKYVRQLSKQNVNVYRSIISFDRPDAEELGLRTQKDWRAYAEEHIRTLAEKNNIKLANLGWCSAYHNEGEHPHLHIVFWDKAQKIAKTYVPPKIANDIRIALIKSTYADKIKALYEQKKLAKGVISLSYDNAVADFDNFTKSMRAKNFKKVKSEFDSFGSKNININQLFNSDEQLTEIAEKLFALRNAIPKGGRVAYKLLPPETKALVDSLTDELISKNTYLQNAIKQSVDVQCELKKLYSALNTPEKLKDFRDKCEADIKKQINTKIIKSVKAIISKEYEVKNGEYTAARQKYFATEMMHDILDGLARSLVCDNSKLHDHLTRTYGDLSELAMKEWYEKNKDKGLEF